MLAVFSQNILLQDLIAHHRIQSLSYIVQTIFHLLPCQVSTIHRIPSSKSAANMKNYCSLGLMGWVQLCQACKLTTFVYEWQLFPLENMQKNAMINKKTPLLRFNQKSQKSLSPKRPFSSTRPSTLTIPYSVSAARPLSTQTFRSYADQYKSRQFDRVDKQANQNVGWYIQQIKKLRRKKGSGFCLRKLGDNGERLLNLIEQFRTQHANEQQNSIEKIMVGRISKRKRKIQ